MPEASEASKTTEPEFSSSVANFPLLHKNLRRAGILAKYAGCYNPRPMRGGNRPSKHSWGSAIDLDPDHNGLKTSWPVAATMPIEVMEEFAREGWIGLGWQIGRDSMHFQPTR
jgi:hypothetical protein